MTTDPEPFILPTRDGAHPWRGIDRTPDPDTFRFVLIGDRTGLARPGIFERGIDLANRLDPAFVIMVGDMIEGYTVDRADIESQWEEFEQLVTPLAMPFFATAGNHDISNPAMDDLYAARFGTPYYSFRYRDCLFLVLNTQDPPPRAPENVDTILSDMQRLRDLQRRDPVALAREIEALQDWQSTMPAAISDQQLAWAEAAIAANADARWTFLLMHMPAWQGEEHPALSRLRRVLGPRPYTMFSGHAHNYERRVIDGRDHIRLGPTGGAFSVVRDAGNFDQVTLVRMTANGPVITNIALDGAFGIDGGAFPPASWREPLQN